MILICPQLIFLVVADFDGVTDLLVVHGGDRHKPPRSLVSTPGEHAHAHAIAWQHPTRCRKNRVDDAIDVLGG